MSIPAGDTFSEQVLAARIRELDGKPDPLLRRLLSKLDRIAGVKREDLDTYDRHEIIGEIVTYWQEASDQGEEF